MSAPFESDSPQALQSMNPAPSPGAPDDAALGAELMSAMADGELGHDEIPRGCKLWREDHDARSTWHAYHLIADVLRSDQLTSAPAGDAAFLRALRERLAREPVVLAPRSDVPGRVRRWIAATAVVGGVAAVAGVMVLTRGAVPADDAGATLASGESRALGVQRVGAASPPASARALVIDGKIIRDARLDAYFDAHRGAVGPTPSAVPGGALRSVETVALPQR